jgi:O-antigen ligase
VVRTRLRQVFSAALGVGVVVALAGALALVGNPITKFGDKVDEFRSPEVSASPGGTRLGSTGGQRYDLWQVAGRQFERAPVVGEGEGSYRFAYYRERQTDRNLITPHSLPLAVLGQLGIVGLLLLVAFLAAAGTAIVRGARRGRTAGTAAAAAVAAAFFAQTLVDWFWLIPGLTGVAVLSLGLAVALASTTEVGGGRRSPLRPLARVAVAVAAVAVAALYLSDYEVRSARAATGGQAQLDAARRAARLDPWAVTPLLLQAGALEELGRRDAARSALQEAGQLEPKNFVVLALRGDLELRAGREPQARAFYRRALQANPKDVGLQQLARGTAG